MQFKVIKPFRWAGLVRLPGQTVEIDAQQAAQIQVMGLIGLPERAVMSPTEQAKPQVPERTVNPPGERRPGRPRKKR